MSSFELGALVSWTIPFGLTGEDGRRLAKCVNELEPQLSSPCQWHTDYVIERIGQSDVASLEYIAVTPTTKNTEPSCVALASCSAAVWARQTDIPMPHELGDTHAFRELGRGSRWSTAKGDRKAFYEQALAEAMQMLEQFESLSDEELEDMLNDPAFRYNVEWNQREIDDYQAILDGMQANEEP